MSYLSPPPTNQQQQQSTFSHLTLEPILEDLAARFIVNLPEEELESMDRVCFQIEQAHWYYEDFVRPTALNPALLPSFNLKKFSLLMFQSCPLLHDLLPDHKTIWDSFMAYKERVPVCGAVLISEYWDKVLLVKGWNKGASWSFPRGKINKEEADGMCAIREVLEETGYDMTSRFPPSQLDPDYIERQEGVERNPYYIEVVIKEQKIRLYFIEGVKEDTVFETRTRKEISKIDWFKLSDLPTWGKNRKAAKEGVSTKQPKFYMVTPFISHLKLWIDRNKPKDLKKRAQASNSQPYIPEQPAYTILSRNTSRQLPPHLQDDTDDDYDRSFSPTHDSMDGDDEDEEELMISDARQTSFATTDEGTLALSAFFLGAPAPEVLPLPLPRPSFEHDISATITPPQLLASYERGTALIQPKPKATSTHTSNLLALLRAPNPVKSPEVEKRRVSRAASGASGVGTANLLSSLDQVLSPSSFSTQFGTPRPQSRSWTPSPSSSQSPSSKYEDGEMSANGTSSPPPNEEEQSEADRKEKHAALLRALYSVVTKTPPPIHQVEQSTRKEVLTQMGARRIATPPWEIHDVEEAPRQLKDGGVLAILNSGRIAPAEVRHSQPPSQSQQPTPLTSIPFQRPTNSVNGYQSSLPPPPFPPSNFFQPQPTLPFPPSNSVAPYPPFSNLNGPPQPLNLPPQQQFPLQQPPYPSNNQPFEPFPTFQQQPPHFPPFMRQNGPPPFGSREYMLQQDFVPLNIPQRQMFPPMPPPMDPFPFIQQQQPPLLPPQSRNPSAPFAFPPQPSNQPPFQPPAFPELQSLQQPHQASQNLPHASIPPLSDIKHSDSAFRFPPPPVAQKNMLLNLFNSAPKAVVG